MLAGMDARRVITVLIAVVACGAYATPAIAEEIVANDNDLGPGSLRAAIAAADPGETVTIPSGIGDDTITLASELVVDKSMTINGAGMGTTSVSGNNATRVFHVIAPAASVTISGLTVTGGNTASTPGGGGILVQSGSLTLTNGAVTGNTVNVSMGATPSGGGGGINNASGTTTLNSSSVSNNTATVASTTGCCQGGGGIFSKGGAVAINGGSQLNGNTLIVNGPSVDVGSACCNGGGGIYLSANAPLSIADSTLTGNSATITGQSCCHGGGAISFDSNNVLTVDDSAITNNTATVNGAAGTSPSDSHCCSGGGGILSNRATIGDSTIAQNTTSVTAGDCCHGGGGVRVSVSSGLGTLSQTAISGNTATVSSTGVASGGGGIWVSSFGNPTPGAFTTTGVLVNANQANVAGGLTRSGGGGIFDATGNDNAYVNTTITGNSTNAAGAERGGGGLYLSNNTGAPAAAVTLANATVADNSAAAGFGGGIFTRAPDVRMKNSIVAMNSAGTGADCALGADGAYLSLGYNLGSTPGTCSLSGTGDQVVAAAALGLLPLAANGGPTQTRALADTSPAIGAGNPAGCTNQTGAPLTTDQRGQPRPNPAGSNCDIGAFESTLATPQIDPGPVDPGPVDPGPVDPGPSTPVQPDNRFTFGKLTLNKKKGTATLAVTVPGPGNLVLGGKDIKPQRPAAAARRSAMKPVTAAGETTLTIKAKGKAKKKLKKKGKAKLTATVTFTPTGGTPNAQTKKLKLKRKRKN